jgi:hypothetical protein
MMEHMFKDLADSTIRRNDSPTSMLLSETHGSGPSDVSALQG